jgi:NAD(P)-dependent dehydrogenase (short-subunit alcohol dehydrogenase family)
LAAKSGSGGKFFGIECDLEKDEDIRKMFESIKNNQDLGRVDVCICNAGLFVISKSMSTT